MIQYNKIIQTFGTGKIEDFFVCNCIFDDLLMFILSTEKITYNDIISKLEEKRPNGFLFLNFYDSSILICKDSFLHYKKIRKSNFTSERCCPEFLKINGEVIIVCLICFLKDIITRSLKMNFFKYFRLVDQFRTNGVFIYMQLPIRTFNENVLL